MSDLIKFRNDVRSLHISLRMSNLREFLKEIRELQVMSPGHDTTKFAYILEGPTNYRK